jgi:hypothetical protein
MRKSMAIVTRINYIENVATKIRYSRLQVISYRQKSQPCAGGSNEKRVSHALAAECKRSTVGSHVSIVLVCFAGEIAAFYHFTIERRYNRSTLTEELDRAALYFSFRFWRKNAT